MEKEARLIFAQIDHVSGEVTGFAIEKIMELGARNVQLIPTITKKNRPGNIMIIDTDNGHEKEIERFLASELKVSGYHRIATSHIFHAVTYKEKDIILRAGGKSKTYRCRVKCIGDVMEPLSLDIEHDFLVEMQRTLKEDFGLCISLYEIRTLIESRLKASGDEISIEL